MYSSQRYKLSPFRAQSRSNFATSGTMGAGTKNHSRGKRKEHSGAGAGQERRRQYSAGSGQLSAGPPAGPKQQQHRGASGMTRRMKFYLWGIRRGVQCGSVVCYSWRGTEVHRQATPQQASRARRPPGWLPMNERRFQESSKGAAGQRAPAQGLAAAAQRSGDCRKCGAGEGGRREGRACGARIAACLRRAASWLAEPLAGPGGASGSTESFPPPPRSPLLPLVSCAGWLAG